MIDQGDGSLRIPSLSDKSPLNLSQTTIHAWRATWTQQQGFSSGTAGFHLVEGWPLFDSFYMALMTLTTVGYGEVRPLSFHGRLFASFLMVVGVATSSCRSRSWATRCCASNSPTTSAADGELACFNTSLDITSEEAQLGRSYGVIVLAVRRQSGASSSIRRLR